VFGLLGWVPDNVWLLIPVLVLGMPFFGALYTPAAAVISESSQDLGLNYGIVFGLTNVMWAAGQAFAAVASGAIAEATSDLVPYLLLALACLGTLTGIIRIWSLQERRISIGLLSIATRAGSIPSAHSRASQGARLKGRALREIVE
jgi:MFS family permease